MHLPKLTPDGAFLLNLGEAYHSRGNSRISTYREELTLRAQKNLGLQLFGKFYWHNPSKPPAGYWVTHAKCRPKNDTEEILWLAPGQPKFRGENALRPYGATMIRTLARGGEKRPKRPSGHGDSKNGFSVDRGGSWPGQHVEFTNAASQGDYFSFCRSEDLPVHPARFPEKLAEKMILLHSDKGDIIGDFFGGSGTTPFIAQSLGRRWCASESHLAYALGAVGRFSSATPTLEVS